MNLFYLILLILFLGAFVLLDEDDNETPTY